MGKKRDVGRVGEVRKGGGQKDLKCILYMLEFSQNKFNYFKKKHPLPNKKKALTERVVLSVEHKSVVT